MHQNLRTLLSALAGLFLCASPALAQRGAEGRVTDPSGEAVIGASVVLKGTTTGVVTDLDGNFRLEVPNAGLAVILVSYVGFETREVNVTIPERGFARTNIQLSSDVELLDEVVVVGYGTQRKRDLVGSIAKLDNSATLDVVGGSFENVLQGKATGLQITQTSGVAGAGSLIRIRGVGSLSAGGDPLIVVDGIPISQDNFLTGSRNAQNNNPLASINPNDIESIEILKDASSAAIYGSRGANGVIIITTRRGKGAKPKLEFSTRLGLSQPTRVLGLLNAQEWLQVRQEAWENDGNTGRAPLPNVLVTEGVIANDRDYAGIEGIDTDWLDQVIQTGFKHEYVLGFTKAGKRLNTYLGATYSNSESYLVGNSFERASARANLDYRLSKRASISLSSSLTRGLNNRARVAWAGGLGAAQTQALPIYPITKADGSYFNIYSNPVAEREYYSNIGREWRSLNSLAINYSPIKDLDLRVTGNYDYMDFGDYEYEHPEWTQALAIAKGWLTKINNWNTFATATYKLPIRNKDHEMRVLGGLEYQASEATGRNQQFRDLSDHIFRSPTRGENYFQDFDNTFEKDRYLFASAFARLNYSYQGKYFAQATYRRDGSSKFGRNRRFGNFPSIGAGYLISEERFWPKGGPVNFLKLKGSWGVTGNSDIDWRTQFASRSYPGFNVNVGDSYNNGNIRFEDRPENPNLQWEVTNIYDAGIEMGFWQDRITFDLTYYYKLTTDALIITNIPASSGLGNLTFLQNVGTIRNKGFEFGLTSRNLTGPLQWTTTLNLSRNDNLVLDVGTATPDALGGGFGDIRTVKGYPVGVNYIVPFSRIDPATGRPIYLDADGNETFVYDVVRARQEVDNIYPYLIGGITNNFNWKNWDLSFLWTFQLGGTIYDDAAKRQLGVVTDWNMRKEVADRWRAPGDIATYPRLTMDMRNWGGNANFWQNNHSLWLYDGSFGRLKNITLGYTKNNSKPDALISNWRVYVNATNLITLTEFTGWDPEISRDRNSPQERNIGGVGVTYLTPPQEKTYNVGINVTF